MNTEVFPSFGPDVKHAFSNQMSIYSPLITFIVGTMHQSIHFLLFATRTILQLFDSSIENELIKPLLVSSEIENLVKIRE